MFRFLRRLFFRKSKLLTESDCTDMRRRFAKLGDEFRRDIQAIMAAEKFLPCMRCGRVCIPAPRAALVCRRCARLIAPAD